MVYSRFVFHEQPMNVLQTNRRWVAEPEAHDARDDFFCLRFGVPYPSIDCAFRTRFRTYPGCDNCDQGRFNLKRHAAALSGRYPYCGPRG